MNSTPQDLCAANEAGVLSIVRRVAESFVLNSYSTTRGGVEFSQQQKGWKSAFSRERPFDA